MSASSQYLQALVGTTVANSYVLDRVLGQGRHGALIDARHVRQGNRCIVRMLRADASRRQALITVLAQHGSISHPHLVTPRDVLVLPDDQLLLASPVLVGQDLNQRIAAGGKLTANEGILLMRQAASALHALHQKGLTHGNLTASNVFFTRYDDVSVDNSLGDSKGSNIIQLIDAGLAILDGQSSTPADDQRALGRMVQAFVSDLSSAQRKVLERTQESRPDARYSNIAEMWRAFEAASGSKASGQIAATEKAGSVATTMVPMIRVKKRGQANQRIYIIMGVAVLVLGALAIAIIGAMSRRKPLPPVSVPVAKEQPAAEKAAEASPPPAAEKAKAEEEKKADTEEAAEADSAEKPAKAKKKAAKKPVKKAAKKK